MEYREREEFNRELGYAVEEIKQKRQLGFNMTKVTFEMQDKYRQRFQDSDMAVR